jgi:DNA-binding MarR family transcriptional regulator
MEQPDNRNNLLNIDRIIHEPARLLIIISLYVVKDMDFTFLMNQTGMTQGNLSAHLMKLEEAKYVNIKKKFVGKRPNTLISITSTGKKAYERYCQEIKEYLL